MNNRTSSFRNYSLLQKLPEINVTKSVIRKSYKIPLVPLDKDLISSTPDPSLNVKLMKLSKRPQKDSLKSEKNAKFFHYSKEILEDLIKSNPITLLSPNDLINQMQKEFHSPNPKENINYNMLSEQKLHGSVDCSIIDFFPKDFFRESKVFKEMSKEKNKFQKKFQVTGKKIQKIIKGPLKIDKSGEFNNIFDINQSINLSKEFEYKRRLNPVIFSKKKNTYSKSFREASPIPFKNTQFFYVPSSNLL